MAIDATGTVSTNRSFPKVNTAVDAPSGKGLNAIVDAIDSDLHSNFVKNTLVTTTGDTLYASAASTPARLAIGSTGDVLTVAAGLPSWAAPAAAAATNYATTLPGSPSDGDEAILVDSITVPTYQWRFRWNNGSSNADKWEFIGGSPAISTGTGGISSTSYTDLGPSITVPLAGQYHVVWTGNTNGNADSSAIQGYIGVANGGTGPVDADAVMVNGAIARAGGGATQRQFTVASASTIIKVQGKGTGSGSISVTRSTLSIIPIRVS